MPSICKGTKRMTMVQGLGTLYTWNLLSPRVGVTARLTADGRTMLRASYGRFSQGVLTGELEAFHRGASPVTTRAFETATGDYTQVVQVVNNTVNLRLDRDMRAPRTDEYSVGVDRELGRRIAVSIVYVHKDGGNFIGWTDVGGQYLEQTRLLPDGRSVPVFALEVGLRRQRRRFLLTNPAGYRSRTTASCWRSKSGGPAAGRHSDRIRSRRPMDCCPPAGRPRQARKSVQCPLRSR